ncbi:MAG: DUF192 domain-containing protein [Bacillota bacterium]|nr:DUF192 domain-containing protein [Bacillota bacterium]
MDRFVVINAKTGARLADRAELAESFWARARGLLGRAELKEGEGLILRPCNSVHMFFMRFPLDVAFLDKIGRVVGLSWNLPPGAVSRIYPRAVQAVELPAGTLGRTGTNLGDILEFRPAELEVIKPDGWVKDSF